MVTKTFEVRDRGTFIPVIAVKLRPACEGDRYLLARSGYGVSPDDQAEYVLLSRLAGGDGLKAETDPHSWYGGAPVRTMLVAHQYIIDNFDKLESGQVVCVEHLVGERPEPKRSERESDPL